MLVIHYLERFTLEIMLKGIKMDIVDIRACAEDMDLDVMNIDQLSSVAKFAPESEEVSLSILTYFQIESLKAYTGEYSLLGNAEKYFLEVNTYR